MLRKLTLGLGSLVAAAAMVMWFAAPAEDVIFANRFYCRGDTDGEYGFLLRRAAETGKPAATARAALAAFSRETLGDPQSGRPMLEAVSRQQTAHPALGSFHAFDGNPAAASVYYANRSGVNKWLLAGPFGRFGRASFFETFPPENGATGENADSGDNFSWRPLPAGREPVRPWQWADSPRGVMYLYTRVQIRNAQNLTLEIRTPCLWQAWFGGKKIVPPTAPFAHADGSGRAWAINLHVAAGTYPLLLKLYPFPADTDLSVWVGFPGARTLTAPDAPLTPGGADNVRLADIPARRNSQAETTSPWTAQAIGIASVPRYPAAAGFIAEAHGLHDDAMEHWRQVTEQYPRTAAAWARLAAAQAQATSLPVAKRENLAQASNATALRLDPECVPALVALAKYESGKKRYREAGIYLARAMKINPRSPLVLTALARLPLDANWYPEMAAPYQRLHALYPRSFSSLMLQAETAEKNHRAAAALTAWREIVRLAPWRIKAYFSLAKNAFLAGRPAEALEALDQAPVVLTQTPFFQSLRGQILSACGKHDAAEKVFVTAARQGGGAAAWHNAGRERLFLDDQEGAAAAFVESLRLSPDQHDLRLLHRELSGGGKDFWENTVMDTADAIKSFEKRTSPNGKTARLIDQTVLNVYPDGSYANYTHGLQAVLTDGGVREASQVERYGEVLTARTILPERELSLEPVFLDDAEKLLMPAVTPGAYIESKYLQTAEASPDRSLRFPQWYFRSPNSEEAFIVSQYVVRVPPGGNFVYATRNLGPNIEFTEKHDPDGTRVLCWTARNMNRALHEEGGLAIEETLPFVRVGTRTTWADVNRMLANYYLGKTGLTREILRTSRTLTAGSTSPAESVRRIFRYVCRHIENTNWRAPAGHILAQRSGDRNLVLLALLKAAGFSARLVAVRPADTVLYPPVWEIPDINMFSDYLVAIPAKEVNAQTTGAWIWLYPAWRYSRAGELPETLAGGTAFIIDPLRGGEFATLPPSPGGIRELRRVCEIAPNRSDLRITGRGVWRGITAGEIKEAWDDARPDQRMRLIEEKLRPGMPELALEDFSSPDAAQAGLTLTVDFRATLTDTLRIRGQGTQGAAVAFAPLPLLPQEDYSNRRTAFHLRQAVIANDEWELRLPPGAVAMPLPADVTLHNAFGSYRLAFQAIPGKVRVTRRAEFPPQRITHKKWNDYYRMAQSIADYEKAVIWWRDLTR